MNPITHWEEFDRLDSSEGTVAKYVFKKCDAVAEAVLYRYPSYKERTVVCCSTQSGCPVGCRFCGAGDYFNRSLTWREIIAQPIQCITDACNEAEIHHSQIEKLQIMFMSMGEPLLNVDELCKAIEFLHEQYPQAQLLISTSAPKHPTAYDKIKSLSCQIDKVGLQFSVHESTDEARQNLIPSPTSTLDEIAQYGEEWYKVTGRKPFFNYCVHDENNTRADVDRLYATFNPNIWECTLSVICEREEHVAAANERQRKLVENFMNEIMQLGYSTRMFNPAGQDDIGGGCGQLWFVQEWMRNNPELARKTRGYGKEVIHTPK
jgi:23S rRNA (adenine2503-C2)-methyltransferase